MKFSKNFNSKIKMSKGNFRKNRNSKLKFSKKIKIQKWNFRKIQNSKTKLSKNSKFKNEIFLKIKNEISGKNPNPKMKFSKKKLKSKTKIFQKKNRIQNWNFQKIQNSKMKFSRILTTYGIIRIWNHKKWNFGS